MQSHKDSTLTEETSSTEERWGGGNWTGLLKGTYRSVAECEN